MASINFLYRSTKDKASLVIRLLYRHLGKDYTIGTSSKIKVTKTYWDKYHNSTKLKDTELIAEQNRVKDLINKLNLFILEKFDTTNIKFIDKAWLELQINQFYNPDEYQDNGDKNPVDLTEYFDYYIELFINNRNSKKKLNTTKNKIIKYEELIKNKISVKDIDLMFFNRFYSYLQKLNYNQNTIIVDFTSIKTICKFAKKTIKVNDEIFDWSLKKDKTSINYLTFEELDIISNLNDLPDYLDNARDWLIISCFTGQRVSDFMRFNKSMIREQVDTNGKKKKLIEFTQKKTNLNLPLALHPKVLEILEKRGGDFPRQISDVKYNKYIKLVGQKAELNELVEGSKLDSDLHRKVKKKYKKYELLTSHIGRRSFATNFYGEIPTSLIMSATGHSTEKSFLNYIGKNHTDRAMSLANYF
ncbi:phage integrase SAM-like domain-containing protein [Flavobacterium difficile]|uniref:Site-specific integrase n=1 Tax=Flavobacterium difficile TaxID=2709659 RepID=A0ABX0I670_9FLAO|nr:phage integrase SAM-like domain-containing protein [Flavobacterium difficile]NHM02404.1 site-specific integrase [Flavobacterium difficile]